jgi:hypothetical protein
VAIAVFVMTPSSSRSSAAATLARAALGGGFGRCCRASGIYDGANGHYYVRDP